MIVRRETPGDVAVVEQIVAKAFAGRRGSAPPEEVALLGRLRDDPGWIGRLSLVAQDREGTVVGHVVCSRGDVGGRPALGLGPVSVHPDAQRAGVGTALVHAVVGAAEAMDEELVALLGEPAFYGRLGFVPSSVCGIAAPDPSWGDYFQVRPLTAFASGGATFTYAAAFGV